MTTVIPATVPITGLLTATTVSSSGFFLLVQTTAGVIETVKARISQVINTSLGSLPSGGNTSQILAKNSAADYDTAFANISSLVSASTGLFLTGTSTIAVGIATGGVNTRQIATGAVVGTSVATFAIDTLQLATFAVTSTRIATGAVGSLQLAVNAVLATTLATGAVLGTTLATGAVAGTSIATGAVGFGWGLVSSPNATTFNAASLATVTPARGFDVPVNFGISASTSAGVLTLSIVANNGTAASATTPILIPFRSATATTGVGIPNWAAITATSTLTTVVGASFGAATSTPFRLWIVGFYTNATTVVPAVINCSNSGAIFPLPENGTASSIGITATSTLPGVFYSNTTASSAPYRIVGYVDYASGLGTPGTYSSLPTTVQPFGPGIKKPGDIVQVVAPNLSTVAPTTLTTGLTSSVISATITPSSAVNLIRFSAAYSILTSTGTATVTTQMYRNAVTTFSNIAKFVGTTGMMLVQGVDNPGTAAATTYLIKGSVAAGTATLPAAGGDGASIILTELMG